MVDREYIPERGDIVWLNFSPQVGHEQRGKRPAIVVSSKKYNQKVRLGLFCPITRKEKNYPFEVRIKNVKISGVVLTDQIKNFDWTKRDIEFIIKASNDDMNEVMYRLNLLIKDDYEQKIH
ncbi:MAG: type II toxin-antitoxin system PemK/MazF family toxin [Elusimicrobiota bacterium]|jgi:mRNA interferase MazF|nr:type II toxin-antitoxin system PemK/MazF family toxin [Elusimicrobiota bacterium]